MSQRRRPRIDPRRLCGVHLAALGLTEAEMRLIDCDLYVSQQSMAILDRVSRTYGKSRGSGSWRLNAITSETETAR